MEEETVKSAYMSTITETFGEDLGVIQKELGSTGRIDKTKIRQIAESLEAGVDVFDDVEKEILVTMARSATKPKMQKSKEGKPGKEAAQKQPTDNTSLKRKRD